MSGSFNRALQVRVADRLRERLERDPLSGLPSIGGLAESDRRELCDVGGGLLAAVAIVTRHAETLKVVARVASEVRRTDLLGVLNPELLLLLVPGLDPVGGQSLVERLRELAGDDASIGIAYRSGASSRGWSVHALAAEAALHATAAPRDGSTIATHQQWQPITRALA